MVFHFADNDFVAFFTKLTAEAACHKINAFGCTFSENNLVTMFRIDKLLNNLTGIFGQFGCFLTQMMNTSVYVGIDG